MIFQAYVLIAIVNMRVFGQSNSRCAVYYNRGWPDGY